jgi:hypothetical protein
MCDGIFGFNESDVLHEQQRERQRNEALNETAGEFPAMIDRAGRQ